MQVLVQPDDGIGPILRAIQGARRSIDIHIFRLDRKVIEKTLRDAIERGVVVRTLIAHTARGGEKALRRLSSACWRSAPPSRAAPTTWSATTARS